MKQLTCEMCGGTDLVKQDGIFICQTCGTKYSVEEAKKMMVEGTVDVSGSTVQVDNSQKLANYYKLARQARDNDNAQDAAKYYDLIRQENPTDWEANFYFLYFTSMSCIVGNIPSASANLANGLDSVINQLKESGLSDDEQLVALNGITAKLNNASMVFYVNIWKQYDPNGYYNNPRYFAEKTKNILAILTQLSISAEKYFGMDGIWGAPITEIRKCDVVLRVDQIQKYLYTAEDDNTVKAIVEKIKSYDATYTAPAYRVPQKKSGGCYVATAVYGSYDCPQVWTLRRYRDYTLAETWYGRAFIRSYYAISPTIVKWFGHTEWFKRMWRGKLDRMVENLQKNGVENTPYEDRTW